MYPPSLGYAQITKEQSKRPPPKTFDLDLPWSYLPCSLHTPLIYWPLTKSFCAFWVELDQSGWALDYMERLGRVCVMNGCMLGAGCLNAPLLSELSQPAIRPMGVSVGFLGCVGGWKVCWWWCFFIVVAENNGGQYRRATTDTSQHYPLNK